MKVVCKPIDMVAWFEKNGKVHPIRFRLQDDDENKIIAIERVRCVKLEKFVGNQMYVFECESHFNNVLKIFEIKYEIETCKWMLFKI